MNASERTLDLGLSHEPGGALSVLELGPPAAPVELVFLHANGFTGRTYRRLLTPLAEGRRVWAPDLRGHGATRLSTGTQGRRDWRDHGLDLVALLDRLERPVVLAGHSMGGTVAVLAALARPERVRRLALVDPVVPSPLASRLMAAPGLGRAARRHPFIAAALRRRPTFPDRAAAVDAYRGRGAFRGWPQETLIDYVDSAFLDTGDGVRLACAPEWEASNYAAQSHDAWRALRRAPRPVAILKAQRGSTFSAPAWTLPDIDIRVVPGVGHMFPMTHPELARAFLAEALAT